MEVIGQRLPSGETVLRTLDRGALARVYLVSDGRTMRALKLLPAGPGMEARVSHEYDLAHDLDHPLLGRVDEKVEVDGRHGLLMPFLPGRPLRWSGADALPRSALLAAFQDLLEALAYLHGRGVVHRDVKPENLLVDQHGRARLLDFDLAIRVAQPEGAAPAAAAVTAAVAGTIAYLSPEQAAGAPASPASDLYAVGVMLYAALTGEVPYSGTVAEVLRAHRLNPTPLPSQRQPQLRVADPMLAGLLAKEPAQRFHGAAAAGEALRALRRVIEGDRPVR